MADITERLFRLTLALDKETNAEKKRREDLDRELMRLEREYSNLNDQYLRCSYDRLIYEFLDLLQPAPRAEIEREYASTITLLQRLGIRMCEVLKRLVDEEKKLVATVTFPDVLRHAVMLELSCMEPASSFVTQLKQFAQQIVAPQNIQLAVLMQQSNQSMDVILQAAYKDQPKPLLYQSVGSLPAGFAGAEQQYIKTIYPKLIYLVNMVGTLSDMISYYCTFVPYSRSLMMSRNK